METILTIITAIATIIGFLYTIYLSRAKHIALTSAARIITTTSTVTLRIEEANKDLMHSNEILPIGFEPKKVDGALAAYQITKEPIITTRSQPYAAANG
ncbi:MAG: hypothetical protein ACLPYB_00090 [Desulfobaccales bacterium]